ncbi:hypothetical protein KSP39_PZI020930 [Platanthera zijinensis]|uniref:3-hydroxyisobutyryl-CoA hydrolase n=1 Tax=Platanthera zijinensis TaxID=2320716 RepID=A0AAP0AYU4_9ASPA
MKALSLTRRSLRCLRLLPQNLRSFSAQAFPGIEDELKSEVVFPTSDFPFLSYFPLLLFICIDVCAPFKVLIEGKACARAAILNRPSALNALTNNMGLRLKKLYESWEDNSDIGFVMMKGSGRAFCAGGDIVTLYCQLNEGLYIYASFTDHYAFYEIPPYTMCYFISSMCLSMDLFNLHGW